MKLFFKMEITDETGRVHGAVMREIHQDAAYMGERVVDENRFAPTRFGPSPFDNSMVRLMKVRQFRRGLLIDCASKTGEMLADHLEDKEGWHGVERQQRLLVCP